MRTFEIFDPLEEGTPVQYVGVYVLRWRSEWGEPSVGFGEVEDADLDAARARIASLEDVLRAMLNPSGSPVKLPDWDFGIDEWVCSYCGAHWKDAGQEHHAPDCPVSRARTLLGE